MRHLLQGAGICETSAIVSDLGQDPGTELNAETGKAEDDFSIWVTRERLGHCFFEVVGSFGSGGSGFQLQQGKHLLAERDLDEPSPLEGRHEAGQLLLRCRAVGRLA